MSAAIVRVREQMVAVTQLCLDQYSSPGLYKQLKMEINVEESDDRNLKNGYAITYGDAQPLDGMITQAVNLEQEMLLTVTKRVFVRNDDEKILLGMDDVYNATEDIIRTFIRDKIGIPDIIQRVELFSMPKPKMIGNGRDILALTLNFRVRYIISY
jgi:hypothetical protein